MSEALIRLTDVHKSYSKGGEELRVLDGLELELGGGEFCALMGPSGSGKTTLLNLVGALDQADSGRVQVGGEDLTGFHPSQLARWRADNIGFVFQAFHLVQSFTALENVMLPLEILGRDKARDTARHWLSQVGLGKRCHHFPAQLSGGEQQRVALARAFAVAPSLLFADEPTGSLDYANGEHVADLLFSLNREQGTALVLVTHDQTLARRCSRAMSLVEGRLGV